MQAAACRLQGTACQPVQPTKDLEVISNTSSAIKLFMLLPPSILEAKANVAILLQCRTKPYAWVLSVLADVMSSCWHRAQLVNLCLNLDPPTRSDETEVLELIARLRPVYSPDALEQLAEADEQQPAQPTTAAPVWVTRTSMPSGAAWFVKTMAKAEATLNYSVIEMYAGHGNFARYAGMWSVGSGHCFQVDKDHTWRPNCQWDLATDAGVAELVNLMQTEAEEGRFLLIWLSWPCEAHSTANTTSDDPDKAKAESLAMFNKVMPYVVMYGALIVGENPKSSGLWKAPNWDGFRQVLDPDQRTHDVNYCRYDPLINKPTTLVFSSDFVWRNFKPRRCTLNEQGQCLCDLHRCTQGHVPWPTTSYEERIKVPSLLLVHVLHACDAFFRMGREVLNKYSPM